MVLQITEQFFVDYKLIKDVSMQRKIKEVLTTIKQAKSVAEITQFKKIEGDSDAYKMGIGLYYLLASTNALQELMLMRLIHRDTLQRVIKK